MNLSDIKCKLQDKKTLGIIIGILVILLFLVIKSCGTGSKYVTKKVVSKTITQTVEASGTVNPVNTFSVGSTVSGLVTAVYVDYNSPVKKGQLLAQIDSRTSQETVNQNLAMLHSAEASLRDMQSNLVMSQKTLTRYKNLYSRGFVPKSELDQAISNYQSDLARVSSARSDIAKARAQYKTSVVNLGFTRIISPVDGVIISKNIEEGRPVAASFQAPEHFVIAQDLKEMQIEVNVSEADIGKIKEGQIAEYTLDGYPNETFKGVVRQVRISPTTVSNVVTYSVIVSVKNDNLILKPGMTANVAIIISKHSNALCVVNPALKFTPDLDKKYDTQGVWVLSGNKLKRVSIKTGLSDDSFTEITLGNIKAGDLVVVASKDSKSKKKPSSGGGMRMHRAL